MRARIKEESVILASVVKWVSLAAATGVMVGVSTAFFVRSLGWGASLVSGIPYYFLLIPAGLFLSAAMVKYLFPEAEGHGADLVIESVHKREGGMKAVAVPVEFVSTWLTLTFGGSAGKEGPSAQIGGGLASVFADIIRLGGADRRKLVICGISGGFASVFGTPLAGAIFGMEVLSAGAIRYDVLLPSFVTGIISYHVSSYLGLTYFYTPIKVVPAFSELFFLKIAVAGVLFGIASFLFVETLRLGRKAASLSGLSALPQAAIGGAALIGLTFIFSERYLGLGIETIETALKGGVVPWYAFIMKSVFTSVTLNFGGSGGIGTPIFYVGATAGSALGRVMDADPAMLSAIGFVSLLAGAANAPIAASIMAVELFGAEIAPYAALASVLSFVMAGHRGAYSKQVMSIRKSSSIDVELDKEVERLRATYREKDGGLVKAIRNILKR